MTEAASAEDVDVDLSAVADPEVVAHLLSPSASSSSSAASSSSASASSSSAAASLSSSSSASSASRATSAASADFFPWALVTPSTVAGHAPARSDQKRKHAVAVTVVADADHARKRPKPTADLPMSESHKPPAPTSASPATPSSPLPVRARLPVGGQLPVRTPPKNAARSPDCRDPRLGARTPLGLPSGHLHGALHGLAISRIVSPSQAISRMFSPSKRVPQGGHTNPRLSPGSSPIARRRTTRVRTIRSQFSPG
jgi:hypothetical protein